MNKATKYLMWAGATAWAIVMITMVAGLMTGKLHLMDPRTLAIVTVVMAVTVFIVVTERTIYYTKNAK